ncbi:hypothetical protein AVEN_50826-1 [Araneus ventricosus]|uniref:Uncharacterized protein n=1 Tax=Araneus ventricosus TaxID=182803 RepID=A0A4Y2IVW0_ARAVE|nr:hypothetical protein AVEN_50826-1 [Araneus ventricosus]
MGVSAAHSVKRAVVLKGLNKLLTLFHTSQNVDILWYTILPPEANESSKVVLRDLAGQAVIPPLPIPLLLSSQMLFNCKRFTAFCASAEQLILLTTSFIKIQKS